MSTIMQAINICFICDSGYVKPTAVAMESLKVNRSRDAIYKIFVVETNLSDKDKELLTSLSRKNFLVEIIHFVVPEVLKNVNKSRYVPISAMTKFYLPKIFKDLDKILYMDGDVLVQSDLVDLYKSDISSVYAGVVKDIRNVYDNGQLLKKLQIQPGGYFNSGMMLLNLKRCRRDNITEQLIEYRLNRFNHHMDQDALNGVMNGRVKFFDVKYNLLPPFFKILSAAQIMELYNTKQYRNINDNYKHAAILHLGGSAKPWNEYQPYLTALYNKYAKQINWNTNVNFWTYCRKKIIGSSKVYYLFGFIPLLSIQECK